MKRQGLFIITRLLLAGLWPASATLYAADSDLVIACEHYPITRLEQMRKTQKQNSFEISRCDDPGYRVDTNTTEMTDAATAFADIVMTASWQTLDIQALETFFTATKSVHGISLLDHPRKITYNDGNWSIDQGLEYSLLDMYLNRDAATQLDYIYQHYNAELKQRLDDKSYFLFALLAGEDNLTQDDFLIWDNPPLMPAFFKINSSRQYVSPFENSQYKISQLLDILIATRRFRQIERYQPILLQHYQGNPYTFFFLSTNFNYSKSGTMKEIQQLRDTGLDIFHYTDDYRELNIYQDSLAAAIVHDLTVYDLEQRRTTYTLIRDLASGLNSCNDDCMLFYMALAIQYQDGAMLGTLFDSLPRTDYNNNDISRLIWLTAKYNNTSVMKAMFEAFKLPEYRDFKDEQDKLGALGYAREHRNKEMIALLKAHGYRSNPVSDFFRQAKRGWSDTKETAEGVGYVIQLLMFGYH